MENKKSRRKWAVLVFAVTLIALAPVTMGNLSAFADEPSLDDKKQLALSFIEKVAGINVSAYTLNFIYTWTDEVPIREWRFNIYLNSGNESIKLHFDVIDNVVWCFECEGKPLSSRNGGDLFSVAREILDAEANHFNASYCTELRQLLDEASPNEDQVVRHENKQLEISENGHGFLWRYIDPNGLEVDWKTLGMMISDDGYIIQLLDWWGVISIGSTEINVSEEQAIEIALPYAQRWAEEQGRTIESVNASLNYDRTGRGDRYTVYPTWHVDIDFNGGIIDYIFGYQVGVWADTGRLYYEGAAGVSSSGSGGTNYPLELYVTPILALIALASIVVYRKRFHHKSAKFAS